MATINESAREADQAVKKLQFAWDKFMEYVQENAGDLEEETLTRLKSAQKDLESNFKNMGQEIEKGAKKTEENIRKNLPEDFQQGFNKFTKQVEEQTQEFRSQVKNAAHEAEEGFKKFQASQKKPVPGVNSKLMAANAQFKAAAQNLSDAFNLYSESVKERLDEALNPPKA